MSWLELDALLASKDCHLTDVPGPDFTVSSFKVGVQFPEVALLRQVVFALLSSFKFAGVKPETDATHSIMMILALMIHTETLHFEW